MCDRFEFLLTAALKYIEEMTNFNYLSIDLPGILTKPPRRELRKLRLF